MRGAKWHNLIGIVMLASSTAAAIVVKQNKHVYCVILAGGSGERLWPFSRVDMPKQLLAVGGNKTLLEQAIERVSNLVDTNNILISTTAQHEQKIRSHVGSSVGGIIVEPGVRNTGPAILLCCMEIYRKDPQAVIMFLPADPFIPGKERFAQFLEHSADFASHHDSIVLLGLKPRYAATGYGYIEFDAQHPVDGLFPVVRFHEKPSAPTAEKYITLGTMLWNVGMFCGKVSVFLKEFETHAPRMMAGVEAYCAGLDSYDEIIADSIDYAVMEKSKNICVLPVDFSWCDVGNLEIFLTLKQDYNRPENQVITVDAHNNLVEVQDKLVALVGVDDLCVIDTGDTLLITKRSAAERVKLVVKELKEKNKHEYL